MPFDPSLDISTRFTASATELWEALTNERIVAKWWPSIRFDRAKPSPGKFSAVIDEADRMHSRRRVTGRITKVIPGEQIRMVLHSEPGGFDSKARFYVSQLKHKSRLRVVESGLPENGNSQQIVAECRECWRTALSALGDYLDG